MKKKTSPDNLVTKSFFKKELKKGLGKEISAFEKRLDKKFAAKKDLRSVETGLRDDMERLENRIKLMLDQIVTDITESNRKHLDQFRTDIDPILREVIAAREDRAITAEQIARLDDRVTNHENRLKHLE